MTYLAFLNFIVAGIEAAAFAANPAVHQHLGFAVITFGFGILAAIRGAKS